ncbi:MAG: EAL domain-containing protein, partial [Clostridia bacterium]|nr:EAL domain-containing protein [Clostridia bacterium]
MNEKIKFNRGDIVFVILILVSVAALVNVFVLMDKYSSGTQEQAILMSSAYADDAGSAFRKQMDLLRGKAEAVASVAAGYNDREDLENYFTKFYQTIGFDGYFDSEVHYYIGDKEYNQRGEDITDSEYPSVTEMRKKGVLATYGIIYGEKGSRSRVACYCPIEKSNLIDGIVVFFPQEVMLSFSAKPGTSAEESESVEEQSSDTGDDNKTSLLDESKLRQSEIIAVCCRNSGGAQILRVLYDKTYSIKQNDSFYEAIQTFTNDMAPIAQITAILDTGVSATQGVVLNGENYIIAIQRANPTDAGIYIIGLYLEKTVYATSFDLVQTAITTMSVLLAVLFVFAVYFVLSRHMINKKIEQINMENPVLNCPTLACFEKEAKQILSQNKKTQFAVVVSHVQHYAYILEKYGDGGGQGILRHLRDVFVSSLSEGETYGYIADGEYVLLLHYKDVKRLENRLMSLFAVARKHVQGDEMPDEYDLKMLFGIYNIEENNNDTVRKMVDKAITVCDMPSRTDINHICNFYNDHVRSNYMVKAEIENRMESALASGEFRVFYQPKYNLDKNRIDGAELLVRWYDPETKNYRSPAEFLPVFEENGFISKLDRHIYYTACEMLAKWVEEGRRVFPISVNISRVTAIQPDFLTYYVKVKKHFNIADNFITLEFTESFAYENYEHLSSIVKELRVAGFLCSIDDFGTGYSTYSVLKLLDM